jgi:hypothetical protein
MSDSMDLQGISNVVESVLCGFDIEYENESELSFSDSTIKIQFEKMVQIIEEDLSDTSKEQLVKVIASIYRSIQRRTAGGREYLSFAQQYVGARVGQGVRALQHLT